jgi:hypothetical protein
MTARRIGRYLVTFFAILHSLANATVAVVITRAPPERLNNKSREEEHDDARYIQASANNQYTQTLASLGAPLDYLFNL